MNLIFFSSDKQHRYIRTYKHHYISIDVFIFCLQYNNIRTVIDMKILLRGAYNDLKNYHSIYLYSSFIIILLLMEIYSSCTIMNYDRTKFLLLFRVHFMRVLPMLGHVRPDTSSVTTTYSM